MVKIQYSLKLILVSFNSTLIASILIKTNYIDYVKEEDSYLIQQQEEEELAKKKLQKLMDMNAKLWTDYSLKELD